MGDGVDTVRHLERAIDLYAERLATAHVPAPPGLQAIRDAGPTPRHLDVSNVADSPTPGDDAQVLAYNYDQVERLLGGISRTTLYRLMQRGDLRKVNVGAAPGSSPSTSPPTSRG